jgi:hypothetical protein
MTKICVSTLILCLLAGCAMPPQSDRPKLTAAEKACKDAPPPTGTHIATPDCDYQPAFTRHAAILNHSGEPIGMTK